jgi:hypothetical protein
MHLSDSVTGHRVERREVGAPSEFENMTDDELERVDRTDAEARAGGLRGGAERRG